MQIQPICKTKIRSNKKLIKRIELWIQNWNSPEQIFDQSLDLRRSRYMSFFYFFFILKTLAWAFFFVFILFYSMTFYFTSSSVFHFVSLRLYATWEFLYIFFSFYFIPRLIFVFVSFFFSLSHTQCNFLFFFIFNLSFFFVQCCASCIQRRLLHFFLFQQLRWWKEPSIREGKKLMILLYLTFKLYLFKVLQDITNISQSIFILFYWLFRFFFFLYFFVLKHSLLNTTRTVNFLPTIFLLFYISFILPDNTQKI